MSIRNSDHIDDLKATFHEFWLQIQSILLSPAYIVNWIFNYWRLFE